MAKAPSEFYRKYPPPRNVPAVTATFYYAFGCSGCDEIFARFTRADVWIPDTEADEYHLPDIDHIRLDGLNVSVNFFVESRIWEYAVNQYVIDFVPLHVRADTDPEILALIVSMFRAAGWRLDKGYEDWEVRFQAHQSVPHKDGEEDEDGENEEDGANG